MIAAASKAKNILIVEDDEEMLKIYGMMFADKPGYTVETEARAEVALRKVKQSHYDLIILDIIMMPMTGDTFYVYLRNSLKTMYMPVLVVTVLDAKVMDHFKTLQDVDFLQKPITEKKLFEKIESMVK